MRVQCWEIWDKRTQKRLVLADDHDRALEHVDWPAAYANFPCETLYFTEYPDTLYGPPDLWHILGQQDAYNEVNAMTLNHAKRFLRKYLVQRGAFDEAELAKLLTPVDGVSVLTDAKPGEAMEAVPDAPIPVDWWNVRTTFRDDHDRVSGVSEFLRGVAEKVDTATEAQMIQANQGVRVNDTRSLVEDFAARVSSQLLTIDARTLDTPATLPTLDPRGQLVTGEFLTVETRALLQVETDVTIEIGSMAPLNMQQRKVDTVALFDRLRNDPLVDQFELHALLGPAYEETVPETGRLMLTREQFQQTMAHSDNGRFSAVGCTQLRQNTADVKTGCRQADIEFLRNLSIAIPDDQQT